MSHKGTPTFYPRMEDEYWAQEACFLLIEDYGLYRHRMIDPQSVRRALKTALGVW